MELGFRRWPLPFCRGDLRARGFGGLLFAPPGGGAEPVRAGGQHEDRQGSWPDDPAVGAGASGPGHRVMQRRTFVVALGAVLTWPLATAAAQAGKVYRIGFLSSTAARSAPFFETFFRALRELGYTEGQNLTVDFRTAEGEAERLAEFAADLVRLKVDLIVASGPEA